MALDGSHGEAAQLSVAVGQGFAPPLNAALCAPREVESSRAYSDRPQGDSMPKTVEAVP